MEKNQISSVEKESFEKDLRLEKKFAPIIKAILGNLFIIQEEKADLEEGTDFLVLHLKPFRIAVRLRRFPYFEKHRNEFTIRWRRPSGVKTEIDKIREKAVDYFFYGFLDEKEEKIIRYVVLDLEVFRENECKPLDIFPNKPHDSDLAVFHLVQFPPELVIKDFMNSAYL